MAKPILLLRVKKCRAGSIAAENNEKITVHLQNKMPDYHVFSVPTKRILKDGFEIEIFNVIDAHDHFAEEIKTMVKNILNGKADVAK